MAQVKIGDREYKLESLTSLDLKKLNQDKEEKKLSDYDHTFNILLYAIKKFNPDIKMTLDEFMEVFPLVGIDEKVAEMTEITGLNFMQKGTGKK